MENITNCNHFEPLTNEESYFERRQLFRNIWENALVMENKDKNILEKPKLIKTLRLDEVDQSGWKKKKQRIKNLRTVCNRILEYCDKQDDDDSLYQNRINSEALKNSENKNNHETKHKKRKHFSKKSKLK